MGSCKRLFQQGCSWLYCGLINSLITDNGHFSVYRVTVSHAGIVKSALRTLRISTLSIFIVNILFYSSVGLTLLLWPFRRPFHE